MGGAHEDRVARLAHAGNDGQRHPRIGLAGVVAWQDADHQPASLGRAAAGRGHHAAPAAGEHHSAGRSQQSSQLLGQGRLSFATVTAANHGDAQGWERHDERR